MAATNYTPIQLYYSTTASAVPLAANLAQGELAINITDGKLYYEDNTGAVQVIATKGAGTIGGSTTQIQYNNAGALAGSSAMTFNNSTNVVTLTTLNLTNALGATYGGTAQSSYTQGDLLYSSATNTLSKLGIGTVDYILTSTGSVPQWSAPSSISVLTATNLAGGAAGSVPYQSAASTTTFLAIGAANRVMTSTGSAPQWVTALTGLTGVSSSSITNTSLTSGRLVYSTTGGAQTDDADLTFNGTTLSAGGFSTDGLSILQKTVTIGNSPFSGSAVFAAATPAKLYVGTGTVTDTTSAIGATNAVGAVSSLGITPIAATNTSVTYTNAATLYIAGAPSAGTNVTLTNPYSLYVAAGSNFFGGSIYSGSDITATGNVAAAYGTYGTFATTAVSIGDGNYGFYVAGGNLLVKSASGGEFSLMNTAGSSAAVVLNTLGNVGATTFSTLSGSATNGMLAYSGSTLQHGLGSAWTGQAFYIGGSNVASMTATGFSYGGVSPSVPLEGYKETAFNGSANSIIRASTKDNYGSARFGYGFYVQNTADEVGRILMNYTDSSGFGAGNMFFQVADTSGGLVTRAMMYNTGQFSAGYSVEGLGQTATDSIITAVTSTNNYGLGVLYATAPNGTSGGALNFWAANNSTYQNMGRIKTICTDGAAGAAGADMAFYNISAGSLTEWLRSDRFGIISSSKKLLFGSTNSTLSGANQRIYAGNGLGNENGVIVAGTNDQLVPAIALTNWDGAVTTNGLSISFDSSGVGGMQVGMAPGANRFDFAESSSWGTNPWVSILNTNGYVGFGTASPARRITLSSSTASGADILLQKIDSGTANQSGQAIRFWNYGPANTARNSDVAIGEIYFGASQPSSGAIQDAGQIIVRADGQQTGPTTKSKMQFLTGTATNGGANAIAQVLYGDQTSVFGGETKGGGRITAYQSGTNCFVCSAADGDNSSDFGMSWYITSQGFTFARIKGVYESSGGTGQGRLVFQTKYTSASLDDDMSLSAFGNLTVGAGDYLGATGDPRVNVIGKGYYYWGSANGLGDFYIGSGTYGLSVGVATGGGGAGTTRIWTQNNGTQQLGLGVANADQLIITSGAVQVVGALSKGSGSFKIDHPLKPETHHLVHSFIEGPQADLIYRGVVALVGGTAQVNIDSAAGMTEGTFVALCRDVQCFTTNESDWTAVRGSVAGNILTIEAQDPTCTASINWMVIGERQDKHMYDTGWTDENGKVIVEPIKTAQEQLTKVN